jgi:hypothetical protein
MSRPPRPLKERSIILPPARIYGDEDHYFVRHDNDPKLQRSLGVVIMAPSGLALFNSRMRPLDKAVLITLVIKLEWFKVEYGAHRSGGTWKLRYAEDGEHIRATMVESGIVTSGLSHQAIIDIIHGETDLLVEKLAEAYRPINGTPIDRERASRILNASNKSTYSIGQVKRSIANLKALGVIIGHERAGPDKLYYILNPFLYCNGPTYMRNALIRYLTDPVTSNVVQFSVDLANAGPPRRRTINADLIQELGLTKDFINDVLEIEVLPEEMRARGHQLVRDS